MTSSRIDRCDKIQMLSMFVPFLCMSDSRHRSKYPSGSQCEPEALSYMAPTMKIDLVFVQPAWFSRAACDNPAALLLLDNCLQDIRDSWSFFLTVKTTSFFIMFPSHSSLSWSSTSSLLLNEGWWSGNSASFFPRYTWPSLRFMTTLKLWQNYEHTANTVWRMIAAHYECSGVIVHRRSTEAAFSQN